VAVILVAATAGSVLAYNARRELARDALVSWLQERGVESELEFETFDLGSVDARLRIGPRADPDVTAELAEVRYGFTGFWNGQPLGVRVSSVRLVRPVVKASYRNGKFSLGSLDPLVEEFSKRPPQPDRGQPKILIEGGRIALDTDYGRMSARADARLEDGRLMLLTAQITPGELKGRGFTVSLGTAELRAATTGRRIDVLVRAPIRRVTAGGVSARDVSLRFDAQGPYPDLKRQRGDGPIFARLSASAAEAAQGGSRLSGLELAAQFEGTAAGWLETLVLSGDATANLTAQRATLGEAQAQAIAVRANATHLKWGRKGGDVLAADLWAETTLGSASAADASLRKTNLVLAGPVGLMRGAPSFALKGHATGQGGWSGLGAATGADTPETAALKRAVRDFRFDAPSFGVALSKGALSGRLSAPLRIRTAGGGEAVLAPVGPRPLYASGEGAFHVTTRGGGLPAVDLAVDRYRATAEAILAQVDLKAKGSFGPLIGAELSTSGQARLSGGALSFSAARCTPFSLARLEMGENDAEGLSGKLCPSAAPLVRVADGGWRVRGEAREVAADVPFLQAHVGNVAGAVDLRGQGAALRVDAAIRSADIEDIAPERRFNPVKASGQATLGDGQLWRAAFTVTDPLGRKLGDARLIHRPDGRGGLDFASGDLVFSEGGLQPADLSPLAAAIGSPATGEVSFTGQMSWTPQTTASGGRLDIRRLDFRSPAGPVTGLSGQVELTSLVPLTVAPGQVLRAEAIATAVPLTGAELTFGLADETLRVEGATFVAGGGTLALEAFEIPLAPGSNWGAVLDVNGVQISDFVEASPFGDRVDMDAKLTGKVPFQVTPQGVRVTNGQLHAIQPGRLSIQREALVDVAAEGGAITTEAAVPAVAPPPPETNTFTEFAYQAMEHLAFDTLQAQVNSQPDGRLGVLFHIKGEHSPPQKQEIRLSILDVIRQTYLTKPLPLPSGTKVDLTLDTTLNLDELLDDFAEYQALRSSQAVQPRR
jgi:hypothetical protein